ncbi:hypothetical protein Zmor_025327 [Zophobas morio]|uniref:Protein BCCIP homolog n=1 Tax=Zophobas morio TaxID=2755281 RepID=A0AA38M4Z8_9CUCU|nr:hypothetical protein Zmor_025327 [Zophobas morio]
MAGAKKSKRIVKPESDEEYQSDESGSYHGQQEIQATFEGRNPDGQDFHGIKQLLQQLFVTAHVDLSQMSDMLIAQAGIGSVLKQSYNDSDDEEDVDMVDESDVFGITSVINLTQHKETPCVQHLYQLIDQEIKKSEDKNVETQFKEILHGCHKLGFLINERFVNIPSKISYPMLNSLQDEVHRMKKKNDSYDFDYYLMICKMWKGKSAGDSETVFSNDEEEIIYNKCDYSFTYSVAGKTDTGLTGKWQSEDKELIPYRGVILFKADKFPSILNQIQNFVLN